MENVTPTRTRLATAKENVLCVRQKTAQDQHTDLKFLQPPREAGWKHILTVTDKLRNDIDNVWYDVKKTLFDPIEWLRSGVLAAVMFVSVLYH